MLYGIAGILLLLAAFGTRRFALCSGRCPDWMRGCAFAHRGLHGAGAQENTLEAFARAIAEGRAIELDVQRTRDNVPMVVHDDRLARLFGREGRISRMLHHEAKTLTLRSGARVTTLAEALAFIGGRVPVLVEVKAYHVPDGFEKNVARELARYEGECAAQSFNPFALNRLRGEAPGLCVGLLLGGLSPKWLKPLRVLKDNLLCAICRPNFVAYQYALLSPGELDAYRGNDRVTLGYVMDESDIGSPESLSRVDCAIFERR